VHDALRIYSAMPSLCAESFCGNHEVFLDLI
jgi:hypothetical protein